jgi:uncharacterized protein YfaS (alpha-2-macroglobulin family)
VAVKPPFAGKMTVLVATDRVLETRQVDVPSGGTQSTSPSIRRGAGAYVLAQPTGPMAGRSARPWSRHGVAWLVSPATARWGSLQLPDNVSPRQTIEVPVTVTGASSTEAYITVAAVDEGILQLTDFVTPDPVNYLFGKRQLGLELRDIYGSLIDGRSGKRGTIRSGGVR